MGSFISRPKIFLNFMVDELVYLARGIDSVIHFVAEERARVFLTHRSALEKCKTTQGIQQTPNISNLQPNL